MNHHTKRIIPAAIAMILGSLLATSLPAQAAAGAAGGASSASAQKAQLRHYALKSGIAAGKMVFMDDKGQVNPVLKANVGDTVELQRSSGEGAEHDLAIPDLKVASPRFDGSSSPMERGAAWLPLSSLHSEQMPELG